MSSTNTSGRPAGYISIPVEIVPTSNSTSSSSHSRHNPPYRTFRNGNPHSDFSNSPSWKPSTSRFQRRQSPTAAYDRLINNSQFNERPSYHQRLYEPSPSHFSRSSEDLLSSPMDSMRYNPPSQNTSLHPPTFNNGYRPDSDFLHPNNYTSSLRRSYDALNDFPDKHQSFPINRQYPSDQQRPYYQSTYQTQPRPTFVYSNEDGKPTNTFQGTTNISNDRSRSPVSQRSESPTRPPPPASQQQQESDTKLAKDVTGPIPMPGAATNSSSPQSNDQQVPSADIPVPPPAPPRDPNAIALEKLEQIKQNLAEFDQQVDAFTGSTRDDRIYKILDEQALKIMMRCDELIDVSADIKEKRKEMIRNVQTVLAKLESKVPMIPAIEYNSNSMENTLVVYDPAVNNNNAETNGSSPQKEESI